MCICSEKECPLQLPPFLQEHSGLLQKWGSAVPLSNGWGAKIKHSDDLSSNPKAVAAQVSNTHGCKQAASCN